MLIDVHRACAPGIGIPAGGIVPNCSGPGCKPDVECVKEHAVGIVRIHRDSLVVPVLRIVAGSIVTVSERAALRALHIHPGRATVCGTPGAELATVGVSTSTVVIWSN